MPPTKPQLPLTDKTSFEDALAQIEQIIERIESGEAGLEESLAEYERGVGLINHCRGKLDKARERVEDLTRKLAGSNGSGAAAGEGKPVGEDDEE